jgi:Na+-translocating ferredoxin:NAD+ oxidoreductase RnfG subunit/predicted small integral membrane protein
VKASLRSLLLRAWRLSLLVLAVVVIQRRQPSGLQSIAVERVRDFFPAAATLEASDGFWTVKDASGIALGQVMQTAPESDDIIGYSGSTNTLIALDRNRRILGLRVLRSGDTTDHLAEVVRHREFFGQFYQKKVDDLAAMQPQAVSGATLTSSAIAEGVLRRMGKSAMKSLRFPQELTLDEVTKLEPKAKALRGEAPRWEVLDEKQNVIAIAIRTAPASDGVVGYKGPSDSLMLLDAEGKTLRSMALRKTYDTEAYTAYVTGDPAFLKTFDGMTMDAIAGIDFDKAGVEGVSGATQTSWGVAEGVRVRAQAFLKEKADTAAWWQRIRWRWQDAGHLIVILSACVMAFTRLRGIAWCRHAHHALLVIYGGFVSGEMLSQGLMAGWAAGGVPWRNAIGLVALAAVALLGPVFTSKQLYCHHICPHGALQQLLARRLRWQWSPSKRLDGLLSVLPFVLLLVVFASVVWVLGIDLNQVEPFDAYLFRVAGIASIGIALAGLLWSLVTPLAYCRFGCPTGALFKMLRFTGTGDRLGVRDWLAVAVIVTAFFV